MSDYVEETEKCPVTKGGYDSHLRGHTYSAPCGWSTYNSDDISHYEWHRRGLAGPPEEVKDDRNRTRVR